MLKRTRKLRAKLPVNTAALILTQVNRLYYSGFNSSAGTVLITPVSATLFIDGRYYEAAEKACAGIDVLLQEELYSQVLNALKAENIKTLALETQVKVSDLFSFTEKLENINVTAEKWLTDAITAQRSVKSSGELSYIKKAQKIAEKGFNHILNFIKPGVSERDIAAELEYFLNKNGSEGVSFDTIVVSGANTSLPHGVPGEKRIKKGDLVTLDFGAVYKNYRSDMTRTVAVGIINDEQQRVYNTVKTAGEKAAAKLCAGKKACDIDRIARDEIKKAGYGEYFNHGAGHGVGLEVHEPLSISSKSEDIIQKGNVLTIEPGIYLPGRFGVRIEDMFFITENSAENLTSVKREIIVV